MRLRTINFYKSENSYSTISNWLSIPRSMIESIIRKLKQFGMTKNLLRVKENPNCYQELWKLCHEVNINSRVVLKDIPQTLDTLGISISTSTIQCCLNRNRLYINQPQWTPLPKPCHIVAWFNFAKKFFDKENCFWEQVLWSKETKIELFQHNDVQKICRKKGEAFLPNNTVPTLKHGGSSMMFWIWFSSRKTG